MRVIHQLQLHIKFIFFSAVGHGKKNKNKKTRPNHPHSFDLCLLLAFISNCAIDRSSGGSSAVKMPVHAIQLSATFLRIHAQCIHMFSTSIKVKVLICSTLLSIRLLLLVIRVAFDYYFQCFSFILHNFRYVAADASEMCTGKSRKKKNSNKGTYTLPQPLSTEQQRLQQVYLSMHDHNQSELKQQPHAADALILFIHRTEKNGRRNLKFTTAHGVFGSDGGGVLFTKIQTELFFVSNSNETGA